MRLISMTLPVPSGTTYQNRVNVEGHIPKGRIVHAVVECDDSNVKIIISSGSRRFLPSDPENEAKSYLSISHGSQFFPVDYEVQTEGEVLAIEGWDT